MAVQFKATRLSHSQSEPAGSFRSRGNDCGKFCRPAEWKMIYSGLIPEPQEEIYKCAACVKKNGSFHPQDGIKPEFSCGSLTQNIGPRRSYYPLTKCVVNERGIFFI